VAGRLVLDPLPVETPRVLYDLTRLVRCRGRPFGTGVDRIDLAIAEELMTRFGEACAFVHAGVAGLAQVPRADAAALLAELDRRWRGDRPAGRAMGALAPWGRLTGPDVTYVNASHAGLPLWRQGLAAIDPDGRMRRLVYVHDLIPLEFPEYQRPGSAARFARFLARLAERPARFVANSADTARRLALYAAAQGWRIEAAEALVPRFVPDAGAPPDVSRLRPAVRRLLDDARPLFVTIGTIEPRKNHLLLLHLWRALAAEGRPEAAMPRLAVVGRRGWENEMVVDILERCVALRPHVVELGDLTDAEAQALLRAARALLMPSFAEGLGVPLLEAAAWGTPAIVSDLPALREIAPPGAQFLDPTDGPAWRRAILAGADAPRGA
jgi:glycosyltransferase involved in cell wall biosynthesis